ncbi:MAG: XdhC family protein, partial [Opitutales bacterium]
MIYSTHSWSQIAEACFSEPDLRYALVSLVGKEGSSYLQPGARLLVCEDGRYWGEISAGCLEEKVSLQAVDCIRRSQHQLLQIDTRPLYGCSGNISLLIEVIHDTQQFLSILQEVQRARKHRKTLQVATEFTDLSTDHLTSVDSNPNSGQTRLVEQIVPPVQLLVLGDWPDGRATAALGKQMGWQSVVYDASAPMFSIQHTLLNHCVDKQTAVLIATHNLARDAALLEQVLRSECGYIGVIGAHKRRLELARLISDYNDYQLIEAFEQIRCPAGLDLGGQGAHAIALSVVAGIQAQLCGRSAQPLCQRK